MFIPPSLCSCQLGFFRSFFLGAFILPLCGGGAVFDRTYVATSLCAPSPVSILTGLIGKWYMNPKTDPRPHFNYWLSFAHQGNCFGTSMNKNRTLIQPEGYITGVLTQNTIEFIAATPKDQPFCAIHWHKASHRPFEPAERHADSFPGAKISEPPTNARRISNPTDC